MKNQDNVSVTFVNTVVGRGILNGVINLSFGVFNFTPSEDGKEVDVDPTIACRLRMDKVCAIQLRDVMNDLLAVIEKSEASLPGSEMPPVEGLVAKSSEKMN